MDNKAISKKLSYILRHHPEKYHLNLDKQGWVLIDDLLKTIKQEEYWKDLNRNDIETMISQSTKKRFEIIDNKIRAIYGHSFNAKIEFIKKQPPDYLYHGTARRFIESIKKRGFYLRKGITFIYQLILILQWK